MICLYITKPVAPGDGRIVVDELEDEPVVDFATTAEVIFVVGFFTRTPTTELPSPKLIVWSLVIHPAAADVDVPLELVELVELGDAPLLLLLPPLQPVRRRVNKSEMIQPV